MNVFISSNHSIKVFNQQILWLKSSHYSHIAANLIKILQISQKSNQKNCTIDFSFTIFQNMNGIFDQIWYLSIKATCHIYKFDFIINFGRQVIFYIIQNIMILKFEDIFLFLWHFYIIRNQLKSIDLSMDIF